MLRCCVLVLFVKPALSLSQLDAPTVAGAIPLVPYDLHGLCGGVLGRNDTLLGVPAALQGQAERAQEQWACRIVEPETRSDYQVFSSHATQF
jgi:hypothetical protein